MTVRQRIKLKLMVAARRCNFTDYVAFRTSSLQTMDEMDTEAQDYLELVDMRRNGLQRLLMEVWNKYSKDQQEKLSIERWLAK